MVRSYDSSKIVSISWSSSKLDDFLGLQSIYHPNKGMFTSRKKATLLDHKNYDSLSYASSAPQLQAAHHVSWGQEG